MQILPETLQRLKETELAILIEFDRICSQIGVSYSLSSGTLLGAVRHGGFIPWDDDIDVAMLREDYNKFLAEGQKRLPDNLFIQTYETDEYHPHYFGKIRDLSTVLIDFSNQKLPMKNGVYIDIFPIDGVSSSPMVRRLDNTLLWIIWLVKYSHTLVKTGKHNRQFKMTVKRMLNPLARIIGIQNLNRWETIIRTRHNLTGSQLTFGDISVPPCPLKPVELMPLSLFYNPVSTQFEKRAFQAIQDHHTYLSVMYGDYMQFPPLDKRTSSHDLICLVLN